MTHAEIQERLPLLALDALDPAEARVVARHLATCEDCPGELLALREALADFGSVVAPMVPPDDLRQRVLAAVRAAPRHRGPVHGLRAPSSRPQARAGAMSRLGGIAAAAAAAVVLWSSWSHVSTRTADVERELMVAKVRAETAERELAAARERAKIALAHLTRERAMGTLDADPTTMTVSLAGDGPGERAQGRISVDRAKRKAVVFCVGMPPPPEGEAYQLWFIASGRPMAGGVFRPEPDGTCVFSDDLPEEASTATVFAVTLEPEKGVQRPTGEVFLLSSSLHR